jgi:hypothetical protein
VNSALLFLYLVTEIANAKTDQNLVEIIREDVEEIQNILKRGKLFR